MVERHFCLCIRVIVIARKSHTNEDSNEEPIYRAICDPAAAEQPCHWFTATLIAGMTGMRAYPQHSHSDSQAAWGDPAWSELEDSMQSMHEALFSLKSTGNNDEDFVRLMLPHHQAALDMAKAELMHGQDPQMRRLAQEIITEQESEIELMQLWLPYLPYPLESG